MAVTTKKTFNAVGTGGQGTTTFTPVSIELNNQDDLDVYVTLSGGTRVLNYRQSTGSTTDSNHPQVNDTTGLYFPAQSTGVTLYNYTLSTDNNTITFNSALPTGAVVSIERRTRDSSSDYTNFVGGSTIRHTDVNKAFDESNFTAQEARNKAFDIEGKIFGTGATGTAFISSDEIVDGTIVDADINASAQIAVNKLADGSAKQLLQTASNGSDVEWTSNVDIPGTLDVTSSAAFDSNVTVSGTTSISGNTTVGGTLGITGTTTAAAINASGAVGVDGNFDVNTNKFTVQASTGNTLVAGNLDVTGTFDVTGTSTYTGQQTVPGGALVKNIEVGLDADNEVSTTSGNLVLDSASGTVQVTDHFNVTGNADVDSNLNVDGTLTVDGTSTLTGNTAIGGTLTVAEIDASGPVGVDGNFDVGNLKFSVQSSNGNTNIDGSLTVGATTTITGVTTVNNLLDVNGQAIIDNVRLNGNEIDTTEGGLTIDSATGTVTVDDNLTINGTVDTDTLVVSGTSTQATVDINGGAIDGTTIGASSASSGAFTSITASSTTTINSTLDVNGLATVDNVRLDGNEIDTTEGNLILDSATGTVTINDNVRVNGTIDADNIEGTAVVTSGSSTSDTKVYSAKRSDELYYNLASGEEIQSGEAWAAADNKIATTAAIDARVIDLVDDVGGFVPIANETSFPNANPDVNNGTGTIVSIGELASNHTSNGSGVISISNGTVGNSTVTINGAANSTTYSAGYGLLVETTTTLNTYTFHRLTTKATEVTTVAGSITNVNTVAGAISNVNAVAGNATNINAVAADATDIGAVAGKATEIGRLGTADAVSDMNTLGTTAIVSDMGTLADISSNITTVAGISSNVTSVAGISSNVTTVAGVSANVTTVAGNNANVTTVAGNISNVNNFADLYQIASTNPSTDGGGNSLATGDLYFNTTANELKVYNGGAWQGGVTASGNFASTTGNTFTGNNTYNDNVKTLFGAGTDLQIYSDGTDSIIKSRAGNALGIHAATAWFRNAANDETTAKFIENGAVELYYNNSKKVETTSGGISMSGEIHLQANHLYGSDNAKIRLGGSQDLEIYHDGSHSYIKDTGTGNLKIDGTDNVELQAGGSTKAYTYANGLFIYNAQIPDSGILNIGNGSDLKLFHDGSNSFIDDTGTGSLIVRSSDFLVRSPASAEVMADFHQNGAVELYYDNSKKFETHSGGCIWTGDLYGLDNALVSFGNSNDLLLYHDGNNSYVINGTSGGSLNIRSNSHIYLQDYDGNTMADFNDGGAVELYYNGTRQFLTYQYGVQLPGHLQLNTDTGKAYFGASGDLMIYHDGTQNLIEGTTPLYIKGSPVVLYKGGTTEKFFEGVADGASKLYYDGTKKFETTSGGAQVEGNLVVNSGYIHVSGSDLYIDDTKKAKFGAGSDLQIYHNASHSFVDHSGTGNLIINGNTSNNVDIMKGGHSEYMARFKPDNAVELYYDNSKKFETHADGLITYGTLLHRGAEGGVAQIRLEADEGDDNADKWRMYAGTDGTFYFQNYASGGYENSWTGNGNGNIQLFYDNSKKFETASGGCQVHGELDVSGHIDLNSDSHRIKLGAGDDFQFWHDGSNNHIYTNVGDINIQTDGDDVNLYAADDINLYVQGSESAIKCIGNGSVELYNNNSKKFYTNADGVRVDDNSQIQIGSGGDLHLRHNGSHSYISNSTGQLLICGNETLLKNQANSEVGLKFNAGGSLELYYDDSKKVETTSAGANITGNMRCGAGFVEGSGERALHIGSTNAGGAAIYFDGDSNGDWSGSDYSWIKHNTSGHMEIGADNPSGNGSIYLYLGNANEAGAYFSANGAAELYYDGTKKFNTTSTGLELYSGSRITRSANSDNPMLEVTNSQYANTLKVGGWDGGTNSSGISRIRNSNNNLHIDSGSSGIVYFQSYSGNSTQTKGLAPQNHNTHDLGTSGQKWDDVYATNGTIQTSNRNEKNTIVDSDLGLSFVNKLKPVSYKFNTGTRTHYGLIAQDVETILSDISKPTTGFAGFIKEALPDVFYQEAEPNIPDGKNEGDLKTAAHTEYGLRYNEFISPLIKAVQELSAEVETLKTKVAALESS